MTERKLKALEKRIERLDMEVWDLLKVLSNNLWSLRVNVAYMEARHCADWKKRNHVVPKPKK